MLGFLNRPGPPPARAPGGHNGPPPDLLRKHSKKSAAALVVLAIVLLYASFAVGATKGLPAAAFGWTFGLQVIRAAVALAIISALGMVILRGWGGMWPQRISSTGLDFVVAAQSEIKAGVADMVQAVRESESENPKQP